MHLYQGTTEQFRYKPTPGEGTSWKNSLRAMATVLHLADQFRIVPSVRELDRLIRERAGEGSTARLVAGFCWPWSDPDPNGELVPDVKVGDWEMPWNAQAGAGKLAPGIPKSDFWASDPNGINQVGCVYTAQGFEFDYLGVIFGPDLVYRPMDGGWVGEPKESFDRVVSRGVTIGAFADFVKSTYRVLLTRGLRGCYVSFLDTPTRDFFLGRTERRDLRIPMRRDSGSEIVRSERRQGAVVIDA